jgi:diacylglycerol kinase family enzyme
VNYEIQGPEDFEKQSLVAVEKAVKDGGVIVAAGGDGTIRGVAQAAHGKSVRFAVVPCGTFNFFARTHRIPEDQMEAFRLALTGKTRPVRLGQVNGHVFLINASLGLYARAIRERESRTDRFGRNRIVATISTILSLLSRHLLLKVDLVSDRKTITQWTPMIFIGNNALQLRDLAMDVARCMKSDLLAVVMMKPITKLETLRIILRGIFKTLSNEERLETFCVEELTIHTKKKTHMIALDGELIRMHAPLHIQALPEALNLVLPPLPRSESAP